MKLEFLAKKAAKFGTVELLDEINYRGCTYPIRAYNFGDPNPENPIVIVTGGVHGLEKVGTHLATFFMRTLIERMRWDSNLINELKRARFCFVPLVNPAGMYHRRRSNPNGIDLMRNAPIEAEDPPFLLGGHRYGPWLPWYRGAEGAPMEAETQAVFDYFKRQIMDAPVSISLDLHSGFGMRDRLWYPYAKSHEQFPHIKDVMRLIRMLKRTHPYHIYKIEPQAHSYTTHGDIWDYLHQLHFEKNQGKKIYLPWTLEMGSWIWVRKNPWQIFSVLGGFNPVRPHRYRRTMRRHSALFEFLFRSILNHDHWFCR